MSNNTNIVRKQRGFAYIEVAIVAVTILILVAISFIAFKGIQNRDKASEAQTLAYETQRKAEAWNTAETGYPSYCDFATHTKAATGAPTGIGAAGCIASATPAVAGAKLDDVKVLNSKKPTDEKTVQYVKCATSGAQVVWYDARSSSLRYIGLGGASSASAC